MRKKWQSKANYMTRLDPLQIEMRHNETSYCACVRIQMTSAWWCHFLWSSYWQNHVCCTCVIYYSMQIRWPTATKFIVLSQQTSKRTCTHTKREKPCLSFSRIDMVKNDLFLLFIIFLNRSTWVKVKNLSKINLLE